MSQLPLLLGLFLVGLLVILALGPRRHALLCCALAFPSGLAVVVLAALALLGLGVAYDPWSLGALVGLASAALAMVIKRRGSFDRAFAGAAAKWAMGFAAVSAVASYFNFTILNYDSHYLVALGGIVAFDGTFDTETLNQLQSWGVFQVLAQSLVMFTRQDYLYALQPVLGGSLVALFAVALWHATGLLGATGKRRVVAVVLFTLAPFSIYNVVFHFTFIHTNLPAAVYLFAFVVVFWLAETERDTASLPLAFICVLAFAIQRIETPMAAVLAITMPVLLTNLPRRAITPWLAGFVLVVSSWYVMLSNRMPEAGLFLTPTRCLGLAAAVVFFLVWWVLSEYAWVKGINRRLPVILPGLMIMALAVAFHLRPEHMSTSFTEWMRNLRELPQWGWSWYAIAVAVAAATFIAPPPGHRAFTHTIGLLLGYTLALAFGTRDPYRFHLVDSANRMTLHVFPLIFFYIGLKVTPVLAPRR